MVHSSDSYLAALLKQKKIDNPMLSLRASSQYAGLSPSMLSKLLNGQRRITLKLLPNLVKLFKLSYEQQNYLILLITFESLEDSELKSQIRKTLERDPSQSSIIEPENKVRVDALLRSTITEKVFTYYNAELDAYFALHRLKNKQTQGPSPHFFDLFSSPKGSAAGFGYFLKNDNGTYSAYTDRLYYNDLSISLNHAKNKNLTVNFIDNFPQIRDINITVKNEPQYIEADMLYSENLFRINGVLFDSSSNTKLKDINREYIRIS